jgi:glycosyltransferase involved in cell wall biosynthesis
MVGVNASIVGANPTGLGLYTINLVRELDKLRDDLVVYTSAPAAFDGLRAPVMTIPAAVRPDRGMRGHAFRALWLQTVQRVRARAKGFRVVLNTVPEAILDRGIPQVTVVHDLLPLRFPLEYPRQQYYFRRIVPWGLRLSRRVIADSESTRTDVVRHFGLRPDGISVVYPGYDPAAYFPDGRDGSAPALDSAYLLYVGNLFPHKNLGRLIEAFDTSPSSAGAADPRPWPPAYARGLHEQVGSSRPPRTSSSSGTPTDGPCASSTSTPRASSFPRSAKDSACPCSRRWPADSP